MNAKFLLLAALSAAALGAWGCREDTDVASESQSSATAEDVRRETTDALEAVTEYLGEKKDEFVARADKELDELAGRFEEWKRRGGETTSQSGERLEALRARVAEKLTQARKELADLKGAGEQTWRDAAGQFSRAMTELRQAYEEWRRARPAEEEPNAIGAP